ncbi:MAG: NAD(P)/FAD-dependent oxidoreductase [Syntrophomonadaceae bacterium]|nr:NAD(P)/FAD-dependent oxidoreductase [Syntrophomonadaceae bacterium]
MRIIIIGNGAAGNQAADTIRKYEHDAEIIIISHEEFPAYSACALPDCMAGWVPRPQLFLKSYADYADKRIETRFNQSVKAIAHQEKKVLLNDEELIYDKLIMATGSRPLIPPVEGSNLPGNFVLKSVSDLDRIVQHRPAQVVVVGSGNIGVEVAEALEIQGCDVTLIEMLERVMPRFLAPKPATMLRMLLEEHNIKVLTGEKVLKVEGENRVEGVITDKRSLACDTLIWAVGVKQNIELAQDAGIEIGSWGGIKVNRQMQTSEDDIFACGDCIESFDLISSQPILSLLWPSAKRQAEVAALNAIGRTASYEGSLNLVVEEIYGSTFVSIGCTDENLNQPEFEVLEREQNATYYRLLLADDRIFGLQAVGNCKGTGAITALIRNKTILNDLRRVIDNPCLIARHPWYLDAANIIYSQDYFQGVKK